MLPIGGMCLVAFVLRQHRARTPMMPLGLFRLRDFASGNLATMFMYGALSLNSLVLVVYLQQGAGLSATLAGLATLPTTIIMIVFSSRVGTWSGAAGPRAFMTIGPAVMAAGVLWLLTVSHDFDYFTEVLPAVTVFGIGLTTTVTPLTATILGAVGAERSGVASAVNNAVSRVSGLVAVAALGAIAGGSLDLAGFRRAVVVIACLLALAAVVSALGIRGGRVQAASSPARRA
jgi:predicted MFS family arabinose efflux permease